jgi:4-amino-4-deoxy-L-arabinose transferase-like glycosyltransferase
MPKIHGVLRDSNRDLIAVVCVFCLAAALRLLFVLAGPPEPLTWMDRWQSDELIYLNAAEAVGDLATGVTSPAEAFELLARRGPLYPLYLALIYGVAGDSTRIVGIVQALTDAASCVLIYLLAKQVFDSRVAALSAGVAALYTPFIFTAGRHLRDPLASFLLLLVALFSTKAIIAWSPRILALSGASLAFTILCNSAAEYLAPLLLLLMVAVVWKRVPRGELWRGVLAFLAALAAPIALWMIVTRATMGTPLISAAASKYYRTGGFLNNLDTDGWITDYYLRGLLSRREGLDLLREEGFPEGVVPDFTESLGFRVRVAARIIEHYPVAFLTVPLKNFYRLWSLPYNLFRYSFGFSYPQQVSIHQILVCLALVGIPVSFVTAGRTPVMLVLIVSYFCVVWMGTHAEPRYNLSLMPYVIIMAACTLVFLCDSASRMRATAHKSTFRLACVVSLLLGLLSLVVVVPLVVAVCGGSAATTAYSLTVSLKGLFVLSFGPVLYLLSRAALDSRKAAAVAAFPVLVLLVGLLLTPSTSKTWHEWTARLADPSQRVRQTIELPDTFDVGSFQEAALMIDMQSGTGTSYDLVVEANGEQTKRYEGGLSVDPSKFDSFHKFYNQLLTARHVEPGDLRQWFEVPVDLSLLAGDEVVVELYLAGETRSGGNYVDIYGDYAISGERVFEGPSFPLSPLDTSLYKYAHDDDYRLEARTRLESPGSASAYYDGLSWSDTDLSEDIGMQSGEYRVRLKLLRPDGSVVIL